MKLEKVQKVCLRLKEKGFNFGTVKQWKSLRSKHDHLGYGKVRVNYVLYNPNNRTIAVFREQANGEYITELL